MCDPQGARVDINVWQEDVSVAYLRAVVVAAGLNYKLEVERRDSRCVDVRIMADQPPPGGMLAGADLLIQLKSTRSPKYVGDALSYSDVDHRLFRHLTRQSKIPHILILVVVPPDPLTSACTWTPEGVTIAECAYWYQSNDLQWPPGQQTMTVRIPREQRFSPDSLVEWMRRASMPGHWGRA